MKRYIPEVYFDQKLFINREVEKELAENLLTARETKQRVLEFIGIAGLGKSELLKWIYIKAKKRRLLSAYIDFELNRYHNGEIYPVLETIVDHLSQDSSVKESFTNFSDMLDDYVDKYTTYYQELWKDPKRADKKLLNKLEGALIEELLEQLNKLLTLRKVVLCLDSTDKAYSRTLDIVEEKILSRFIDNQNLILIVAGQHRLKWTASLEKRVTVHQLERFEEKDTSSQLDRLLKDKDILVEDKDELYKKVWELTLGHPFGSYTFWDSISDGFRRSLKKEIVQRLFPQSIKSLVENVVKNRMLANLDLGYEYPLAEEILLYLAPLRRIEFSMLHFILTMFLNKWFDQDKPFTFFENMLGKFQADTHIFSPWVLGIGYDMNEVARSILLSHLRINYEEKFIKIQETLVQQYDELVKQTRDASQIKNIVEKLYHQTLLLKEEKVSNITTEIKKELGKYLENYFTDQLLKNKIQKHEQLDRLKKAIENDKELSEMIDISELLKLIENRMN